MNECPELSGAMALTREHREDLRVWVEANLHTGKLKES